MHAHRIEVFYRTDNDAVVGAITHHFHFKLFPAQQRFFNQQLFGRARFKTTFADLDKLFAVVGDATTRATHREGRANHGGESQRLLYLQGFFHAVRNH